MSKFQIDVQDIVLGSYDAELFEGDTAEEAAFRAGFSMGAYYAFMIPPLLHPLIGDDEIDEQGRNKVVKVTAV